MGEINSRKSYLYNEQPLNKEVLRNCLDGFIQQIEQICKGPTLNALLVQLQGTILELGQLSLAGKNLLPQTREEEDLQNTALIINQLLSGPDYLPSWRTTSLLLAANHFTDTLPEKSELALYARMLTRSKKESQMLLSQLYHLLDSLKTR